MFNSELQKEQKNNLLMCIEKEPIDVLTDGIGNFRVTWLVKDPDIFLVVKIGQEFHTMKIWEGDYKKTKRYWCTNKSVSPQLRNDVARRARVVVQKLNNVLGG